MKIKRLVVILLSVILVAGLIPAEAFANESPVAPDPIAFPMSSSITAESDGTAVLEVIPDEDLTGVKYQWGIKNGDTLSPIDGATSSVYTAKDVTSPTEFYCTVTADGGKNTTVYISAAPYTGLYAYDSETGDPEVYLSVKPGESKTFKVDAGTEDAAEVSFSWYYAKGKNEGDGMSYNDESKIIDAQANTYTTDNITEPCKYVCKVNDQYGSEEWISYYIEINSGLNAYADGTDNEAYKKVSVEKGSTAVLKVIASAESGTVNYAWYKGNESTGLISGAVSSSYTTPAINENTSFMCRVSDSYGNNLDIHFESAVENGFSAYASESGSSYEQITAVEGNSVTLRVEASASAGEISYVWESKQTITDDNGFEMEDWVAIDGNGRNTLIFTAAMDSPKEYRCTASDQFGNSETIYFDLVVNEYVDNNLTAVAKGYDTEYPQIILKPEMLGKSITLEIEASADKGDLTYQWYGPDSLSQMIEGADSNILKTEPVKGISDYACVVTDDFGNDVLVWYTIYFDSGLDGTVSASCRSEQVGDDLYYFAKPGETVTLTGSGKSNMGPVSYSWFIITEASGKIEIMKEGINGKTLTVTIPDSEDASVGGWLSVSDGFGQFKQIPVHSDIYGLKLADEKNDQRTIYVEKGSKANLKLDASVERGSIRYSWYKEDALISDAKSDSYATDAVTNKTVYKGVARDNSGYKRTVTFTVVPLDAQGDSEVGVVIGEGAPDVSVNLSAAQKKILLENILTAPGMVKFNSGKGVDVKLIVDVEKLTEAQVPANDKALARETLDRYPQAKEAEFLDISLMVQAGDSFARPVSDTGGIDIPFTLNVPNEYQDKNESRMFYLIHVHDGASKVAARSADKNLHFSLGHFSTFLLAYSPYTAEASEPAVSAPQTGDSGTVLYTLLAGAAITAIVSVLCITPGRKKNH